MKHLRKLSALLVAMVMVFAMSCTTFAATLTIKDTKGTAADNFAAYQIFTGTLDSTGKILSELVWGSNVTPDADGKVDFGTTDTPNKMTAAEAAAAIKEGTITADDLAKVVTGNPTKATAVKAAEGADYKDAAVFEGLADGYYLVMTDGTIPSGTAATKYILQVVGDVTATVKTDAPTVEKKIKNDDEADTEYRDANNVAIGDTVDYRITSTVPDMSDYTQYYFIMNDTMSAGLTYEENSMVVKVGNTTLTATTSDSAEDASYKLEKVTNADNSTSLKIVFSNFKQYSKGDAVVVTYKATLNESCKINSEGNPNNVDLTYSNNPNVTGSGKNQPGDSDEVTGTTPKDWVITYTTKLGIKKTSDDGKELAGATFTFVGEKTNSTTTVTEVYEENADGTWYKLVEKTDDGKDKYTQTAPTDETEDKYESTTTKYILTKKSTVNNETETVFKKITTDENGYAELGSLAEGTYTITELVAPDGYNLLKTPITITITCDSDSKTIVDGTETAEWNVTEGDGTVVTKSVQTVDTNNDKKVDETDDVLSFDEFIVPIINYAGATLPTTGGIGTTLFYVFGGLMVAFAGILLITKRRMAR